MIYEPTQLEGVSYGTQGWNNIYSSNFEKLNDYLAKFEDLWNSTPDDWNILRYDSSVSKWIKDTIANLSTQLEAYLAKKDLSNVDDNTILNKIKNVDGSGSGLDADLLDGKDSSDFLDKSTYDSDNDGIVEQADNANKVDNCDVDDTQTGTSFLWTSQKISNELSNKADINHTHTKNDITDFNENDYVHTSNDETIAGNKTFSNDITVNGSINNIAICTCWGKINSDGTIGDSYNLASVNHSATGVYEISFSNAMANANYSVVATCNTSGFYVISISNITTSGFTVEVYDNNNQATDVAFSVQVFGGK